MTAISKPKGSVELAGKLDSVLNDHVGRGQNSKGKLHGLAAVISHKDGGFLPMLHPESRVTLTISAATKVSCTRVLLDT